MEDNLAELLCHGIEMCVVVRIMVVVIELNGSQDRVRVLFTRRGIGKGRPTRGRRVECCCSEVTVSSIIFCTRLVCVPVEAIVGLQGV